MLDHFHAIRLASETVNDVRRRVQQDSLGHRGRKGEPLYGIRRLLLMTWKNLNDKGWERLRAGLAAGDRDGEVAAVWLARELLSEVYTATNLAHAKRRRIQWSLNGRPRKTLGYLTPSEKFTELIAATG